jgi:hypothetical protein
MYHAHGLIIYPLSRRDDDWVPICSNVRCGFFHIILKIRGIVSFFAAAQHWSSLYEKIFANASYAE